MLSVEVVTPERVVHKAQGDLVLLPTVEGQIGVRKGHIPLIVPLKAGEVIVKQDNGEEELYAVAGGFAEILDDQIHILADNAARAEELSEEQVQAAIERARKLKEEATADHEFSDAAAQLEANLARLKIIQRKKARGKSTLNE